MGETSIEWTRGDDGTPGMTWNPVSGCSKVSQGCKNCYAERVFPRVYGREEVLLSGSSAPAPATRPRRFTDIALHPDRLDQPLRWRKPRRVFVNSMSDLFHEDVPDEFIDQVFAVMAMAPQHTFQVLTKRSERMRDYMRRERLAEAWWEAGDKMACEANLPDGPWDSFLNAGKGATPVPLPHVWLGVSVEDRKYGLPRVDLLREVPAAVRFLSIEPLLEDLGELDLTGISWVIVGGESGPGARPFDLAWARSVVEQCREAGVACFVKQLGARPFANGTHAKNGLRLRDRKGGDASEWPEDLRVREFPA